MSKVIEATALYLCNAIGARPPGSEAEEKAAIYLRNAFDKVGIEAEIETFKSPSHRASFSDIEIGGKNYTDLSFPVLFSPAGNVSGKIVYLDRKVLEKKSLRGLVGVWIPGQDKGILSRNEEVLGLEAKGLEALIVISPWYYRINTKIVREPRLKRMPVVSVSMDTAADIIAESGKKAIVGVKCGKTSKEESRNVVARIPGKGKNWLFAGAHYDTAPFCQGATDNTGGTSVLLAMSEILKEKKPCANIYLVAFGSEEYGGLDGTGRGPWDFLERRKNILKNCLGYINIDSIGCIPGRPRFFIGGNRRFMNAVLNAKKKQEYIYEGKYPDVTADFGPAEKYGIPYVFFHDRIFPYLHTPEDSPRHLDLNILGNYAKDIAGVAAGIAKTCVPYPVIKKDDITVRQARHADIDTICRITSASFGPVSTARMEQDYFGEKLGGKNWDEYKNRDIRKACEANIYHVIVAEKKGKVVGYATYGLNPEKGIATISNNAVRPDCQGRGIGKLMQNEVKRRMEEEGYKKFSVSTLSNDIPAQKIYEKLGYQKYVESYYYLKKKA